MSTITDISDITRQETSATKRAASKSEKKRGKQLSWWLEDMYDKNAR